MGSPKMSFSLNEMVDRYWTPSRAPVQPLLLGGGVPPCGETASITAPGSLMPAPF
jgi:hypothetical protein